MKCVLIDLLQTTLCYSKAEVKGIFKQNAYSIHLRCVPSPTDEEDGEGNEEQEDMGNQVESVHETAIVQHALLHAVGIDTFVIAAKRQGHATTQLLHTSLESISENMHRKC